MIMFDIVGKKIWYFTFSGIMIALGIVAIAVWGLNLGIDFTGGTLVEVRFETDVEREDVSSLIEQSGLEVSSVTPTREQGYIIRTNPLNDSDRTRLTENVQQEFTGSEIVSIETIGPIIGQELLQKAAIALGIAVVAIICYIAWAFRSVPSPTSSWRFGATAVATLLHDVVIVVGIFAVLGKFLDTPVDSLFITALLTIIGFSVHDTIVVFDRIRENLNNKVGKNFADTVNHSINQTLVRSINTSFTVILVLLPILLFGGASLRWFILALLIGVVVGTYSSIFTASLLLVAWQNWSQRRKD